MITKRINQDIIFSAFDLPFITAILGPRRVGKTTLIKEYISHHPELKWVQMNMDDLSIRQEMEQGKLRSYIEQLSQQKIGRKAKIWVVIDEAQKCPALFEQVKILYDEFKDKEAIKFIISGSASLNLYQLSSESLAGRIFIYWLRAFGLKEAFFLQNEIALPEYSLVNKILERASHSILSHLISELGPFKRLLERSLQDLLIWGGLPEVLKLQETQHRKTYLLNYLQTYLERDVRAVISVSNLKLFQDLMTISAQQTGAVRDDTKVIQALGCNRETLKKYRSILEATLLFSEIYPFIDSSLKRIVKSPKGYLLDNGLISYLTGFYDFSMLETTGLIGHRLENWFLNELHIMLDQSSERSGIYFWRTSVGAEVDFVVKNESGIFPFEITYGKKIESKKVNNLKNFMKSEKVENGFYIYLGDFYYDELSKIYFLPAWAC